MKYLKALIRRIYGLMIKYPLSVAAAAFLIVGAAAMALLGHKIQIGGLLEKLFKKNTSDARVLPPPNRKDSSGNVIEPGQSDEHGYVQTPVGMTIKEPGILSNPDTITVVNPDNGNEVTLPLPTGVKNDDVVEVIKIGSNTYQIKNNDSGVDTSELKDILK